MPIVSTDCLYKLTTRSGTAGNQNAQANVNLSLGKYISTTAISLVTPLNNLFDDITGDENAAGRTEYRCMAVHNAHASIPWRSVKAWISSETAGGASLAIGVDPAAASPIGQAGAQGAEIADETAAPAGVSFSSPTTKETGISLGDIPAGYCRFVWVRRVASQGAAVDNDGGVLRCEGDTSQN